MSDTDWAKAPNTKNKWNLPNALKYVWAAICAGAGSGVVIAVLVVILDMVFRAFGKSFNSPSLDFKLEAMTILLVVLIGGALGLMIGTPIALVLGGVSKIITKKLAAKTQYNSRIAIGAIVGLASYALWQNSFKVHAGEFDIMTAIEWTICGFVAAIIFMKLEPMEQA